jgi:hypothetical protein
MVEATRCGLMDAVATVHHCFHHYVHLLKPRSTTAELLDRSILLSNNETAHPSRHAAIIHRDRVQVVRYL